MLSACRNRKPILLSVLLVAIVPSTIASKPPEAQYPRPAVPVDQERWLARIQERWPSSWGLRDVVNAEVGVEVDVGANGRVTGCRVTRSSAFGILDEAACNGMRFYARFYPALDKAGQPIASSFSTTINYDFGE